MDKVKEKLLDKILYIGEEIPESIAKDQRTKFIILGTPAEFL